MQERKPLDRKTKLLIVAGLLLIAIITLFCVKSCEKNVPNGTNEPIASKTPLEMDESQGDHVELLTSSYERNITLPGWSTIIIPAGTTKINNGISFYNPEANCWYEVGYYYGDELIMSALVSKEAEEGSLISLTNLYQVSTNIADLGISEVIDYNSDFFDIEKLDTDDYSIHSKAIFEGNQEITVKCNDGETRTLVAICNQKNYYVTFALYIDSADDSETSELLYESKLVAPSKYIESIEISRPLEAGEYNGYILIQPYKDDKATATNNGMVKIKLIVQ